METTNNQYSQKKEVAILALKDIKPESNNDVVNIIETILECYRAADACIENGRTKVHEPNDQSNEVKFLIEELTSFIEGINK